MAIKRNFAHGSDYNEEIQSLMLAASKAMEPLMLKIAKGNGGDGSLAISLALAALNRAIITLLEVHCLAMKVEPGDEDLKRAMNDIQDVIHRVINNNWQRATGGDN